MSQGSIFHALGLHMHQPPGNLKLLIEANEWEARQIMNCYARVPRYAEKYADLGPIHVGFSGVLLDQFRDPDIQAAYRDIVDIPAMIAAYAETEAVELIGMGHYHPIFPLIPEDDWAEQLALGRDAMKAMFGRAPKGFWPPEMAFSMEMIPALVAAGYEYVVVDGVHVLGPDGGAVDLYRPYTATFGGASITVVPRDRDLSNAQESGLDAAWFANETRARVAASPAPRLVTTWSDGENGGWFRQMDESAGFFGHFYSPYREHVRRGEYPVRPVSLSAYLAEHPPAGPVTVKTGAWNVGSTSGEDLSQWAGSGSQKKAVADLRAVSARYWEVAKAKGRFPAKRTKALKAARALLLEAETSCFLFWGDAWIPKLYDRLGPITALLDEAAAVGPTRPPGKTMGKTPAKGSKRLGGKVKKN